MFKKNYPGYLITKNALSYFYLKLYRRGGTVIYALNYSTQNNCVVENYWYKNQN